MKHEKQHQGTTYLVKKVGGHGKEPKYWHIMGTRKNWGRWRTVWIAYLGVDSRLSWWVNRQIELKELSPNEGQAIVDASTIKGYVPLPRHFSDLMNLKAIEKQRRC